ncbi:MAG: hypothetical protein ABI321_00350 [Polyangia bacterium]
MLLFGCSGRALETTTPDLAVADLASPRPDLATPLPRDLGPLRHLGEPCDVDAQCLSGDCVTATESRGDFDQVCGQVCGHVDDTGTHADPPCIEGICLSFDTNVYWCLPTCDAQNHNSECQAGFVCCSGGGVQACVSPRAIACLPL